MSAADFWSRRKAAVAEAEQAEALAVAAKEEAQAEAALEEKTDEEILAELNLREPEELETPEAVREFLSSAVPQRLKTRALRKLWRINPVLANLDGLIDYGEDFTDSAMIVENLQTAYQVGKGMLAHIEALAAEAKPDEEAPLEEDAASQKDEEAEEPIVLAEMAVPEAASPAPAMAAAEEDERDERPIARRRMQFVFEETA